MNTHQQFHVARVCECISEVWMWCFRNSLHLL